MADGLPEKKKKKKKKLASLFRIKSGLSNNWPLSSKALC